MEGRAWLVAGGFTTVATSVAVVAAVALSNAVALADSAGASVSSARVLVPAAATPASPAAAHDEVPPPVPSPQAEVVEAPAPIVVDLPGSGVTPRQQTAAEPTGTHERPSAPVVPRETAGPAPAAPAPEDAEGAAAAAQASGSWDVARQWAIEQGWPAGRIDAWIERLKEWREAASQGGQKSGGEQSGPLPGTSAIAEKPAAERDAPGKAAQHDKTSRDFPQRPAHAGSPHDQWSDDRGRGAKEDRSRDSPD